MTNVVKADAASADKACQSPSSRLASLMNLAKGRLDAGSAEIVTPEAIADALEWCYGGRPSLWDALHHALAAWQEASADSRYEMGTADLLALVMSPVSGFSSIDLMGPRDRDTQYSVGQFYGAMLVHILGALQATRCDWCVEQLDEAKQKAVHWEAQKSQKVA